MPKDAALDYAPADADGQVVATLSGELDLDRADDVRDELARIASAPECKFLRVDVSGLDFLDSYGLGALVSARNSAAAVGVTLTLAEPSPPVRKAIEVTGLGQIFGVS
jgi:anti-sigma B factor antagonist